jgi:hypothetical protein
MIESALCRYRLMGMTFAERADFCSSVKKPSGFAYLLPYIGPRGVMLITVEARRLQEVGGESASLQFLVKSREHKDL